MRRKDYHQQQVLPNVLQEVNARGGHDRSLFGQWWRWSRQVFASAITLVNKRCIEGWINNFLLAASLLSHTQPQACHIRCVNACMHLEGITSASPLWRASPLGSIDVDSSSSLSLEGANGLPLLTYHSNPAVLASAFVPPLFFMKSLNSLMSVVCLLLLLLCLHHRVAKENRKKLGRQTECPKICVEWHAHPRLRLQNGR